MRLFAIADLHLSLSGEKPMDVFGERWRDHHLTLERRWRELVSEEDLVLVPGDISWAMRLEDAAEDLAWVGRLPGRKLLLRGNHDYWWGSLSRVQRALPEGMMALQNDAFRFDGFVVAGSRGWLTPVSEGFEEGRDRRLLERELGRLRLSLDAAASLLEEGDRLVVMTHYPPLVGGEPTELAAPVIESGASVCVYGHLHGEASWPDEPDLTVDGVRYILVSADFLDFTPKIVPPARG